MRIIIALIIFIVIAIQTSFALFDFNWPTKNPKPINVGLLYAQSGTRAIREKSVLQANLMAIQEINNQGGLLGRQIVPVIRDTQSKWDVTLEETKRMLLNDQVNVIFGCWISGNSQDIKHLMERFNGLLLTPFQYEGIVNSDHIVFMGTMSNQQVTPTINYCLNNLGNKFFLVGSDYPFPYMINAMAKDQIIAKNGNITGEVYIPFGETNIDSTIAEIKKLKPNAILCSLSYNDIALFFQKLAEAGISSTEIPVFTFTITEEFLYDELLKNKNIDDFVGHFSTWNYFQSIDTPENKKFVENFKTFSNSNVVGNTAEAAYSSVYLWAKGVRETEQTGLKGLHDAFKSMRIEAPEGPITMTLDAHCAWKYSRIGKIKPDGQFEIVWVSPYPIRPTPFLISYTEQEWKELLDSLHSKFNDPSKELGIKL